MQTLGEPIRESLRSGAGLLVLAVLLLALLPLALATWAFGRSYRASEVGRADARLVAGRSVVVDRVRAAADDASRTATALARTRAVQVALAHGDTSALGAFDGRHGDVRVTFALGAAGRSAAAEIARTVVVTNGGVTVGRVTAAVPMETVLRALSRETGFAAAAVRAGRVRSGALAGATMQGPTGAAFDARLDGRRYRTLLQPLGSGQSIALLAPYSAIEATVLRRQLLTLAAGALTLLAIALVALLLLPRARSLVRSLRGANGRRSPLALVGDVAVAAHDPHALLPVILETAVVATEAAGGQVVWNGSEISSIGVHGNPERALVLALENDGGASEGRIVLHPGRRGFAARDREIVESLVAQGRIALENARLQGIVQRQAHTDELTDLANRRQFMERLHQEIARAARFGSPLSLVLFDLDRFKRINDLCGHLVGDDVLCQTAGVIRRRVRETDLAARIGGEEFAVVLSGTNLEGALALAEHLRRDVERQIVVPGADLRVTASFGVAVLHAGEAADSLIGAADRALYRAKAAGRNAVRAGEATEAARTGTET